MTQYPFHIARTNGMQNTDTAKISVANTARVVLLRFTIVLDRRRRWLMLRVARSIAHDLMRVLSLLGATRERYAIEI
jgi:hypothetical protein